MNFKQVLKTLIPNRHFYRMLHLRKKFSLSQFKTLSYSGDGEDIVIMKYFNGKKNGLYIDIGAFHPKYISNTYLLHRRKKWSGINIDPNKETIKLFNKYRPNDINLNAGISKKNEILTYHNFTHSGVNTFDESHAESKEGSYNNKLISTHEVRCFPLRDILTKHLEDREIDVLDIDVEGMDLQVLESNDWSKHSPQMILVEDRDFRKKLEESNIYKYLKNKGYRFHCYNNITLVMVRVNA